MSNLHHKRRINRECVSRWNEKAKELGLKRKCFHLSPEVQEMFDKLKKSSGKKNDEIFAEAIKVLCKRWNV